MRFILNSFLMMNVVFGMKVSNQVEENVITSEGAISRNKAVGTHTRKLKSKSKSVVNPLHSPTHHPSGKGNTGGSPSCTGDHCPQPSRSPSTSPSQKPSIRPTKLPSSIPSRLPSKSPSVSPSLLPSVVPTTSTAPTSSPSGYPSISRKPSLMPSAAPSLSSMPSNVQCNDVMSAKINFKTVNMNCRELNRLTATRRQEFCTGTLSYLTNAKKICPDVCAEACTCEKNGKELDNRFDLVVGDVNLIEELDFISAGNQNPPSKKCKNMFQQSTKNRMILCQFSHVYDTCPVSSVNIVFNSCVIFLI